MNYVILGVNVILALNYLYLGTLSSEHLVRLQIPSGRTNLQRINRGVDKWALRCDQLGLVRSGYIQRDNLFLLWYDQELHLGRVDPAHDPGHLRNELGNLIPAVFHSLRLVHLPDRPGLPGLQAAGVRLGLHRTHERQERGAGGAEDRPQRGQEVREETEEGGET